MGGQCGHLGRKLRQRMNLLLVVLGVLLAATGASPIAFYTGYSQSAWVSDNTPKLKYQSDIVSRPGLHIGISHAFPHLRLEVASVARGTRSKPGTIRGTRHIIDIDAIELSALGELGLSNIYVLAGPYAGMEVFCSGIECTDSRINWGIKYGIGARRMYEGISVSLELVRHQGLVSVERDDWNTYDKGFTIQVGIGPIRVGE